MSIWPTHVTPEIGLLSIGFVVLVCHWILRGGTKACALGFLLALFVISLLSPAEFFYHAAGSLLWDQITRIVDLLALGCAALMLVLDRAVVGAVGAHLTPIGRLVAPLVAAVGVMLLGGANDLVIIWVALEVISAACLLWLCSGPLSIKALEAAIKLFVLSAVASAFFILGIAYLAGTLGTTYLDRIEHLLQAIQQGRGDIPLGVKFGALCCFIGLAIRFAWVPFHFSAPDAGEGLPIGLTAFLQTSFLAGGIAALMRLLLTGLGGLELNRHWVPTLSLVAGLTLALGHLLALPQRNLRRLLAYLAIGQAGFALTALLTASPSIAGAARFYLDDARAGQPALLIFLVVHTLTFASLYLILDECDRLGLGGEIHHLTGLARRAPVLAAGLTLALVTLAGLPPFAGFFAKIWIVLLAENRGLNLLTLFLLLAWLTTIYAILNPIKAMFWSEPIDDAPLLRPSTSRIVVVAVLLTILLVGGFWPGLWNLLLRGPGIEVISLQTASPPALLAWRN